MPLDGTYPDENGQRLIFNRSVPNTLAFAPKNLRHRKDRTSWPCKAGSARGKVHLAADFDAPLEEFKEYME